MLGKQAERWAERIKSPKRLVDKLGIKPESTVVVLGVKDASFREQLETVAKGRLRWNPDLIVYAAKTKADLKRLGQLQPSLRSDGAIWVVAPKGTNQLTERDVLAAGRAARLVDTKVVRFSETLTAHESVIPLARR